MCFSKTPKIETPPAPPLVAQPLAPEMVPVFGNEELKKAKKSKKRLGTKQLQIPLGGGESIDNRAGIGIPKG